MRFTFAAICAFPFGASLRACWPVLWLTMSGFSQCPYCGLWLPPGAEMTHLSQHPGYAAAFLGQGPPPTVGARAGPLDAAPHVPLHDAQVAAQLPLLQPQHPIPQAEEGGQALPRRRVSGPVTFAQLQGKSMTDIIVWLREVGEARMLTCLLEADVVRPLGRCGCHADAPILVAGIRPSQATRGPRISIACGVCKRCQARFSVS